jgi:hypothetical protein
MMNSYPAGRTHPGGKVESPADKAPVDKSTQPADNEKSRIDDEGDNNDNHSIKVAQHLDGTRNEKSDLSGSGGWVEKGDGGNADGGNADAGGGCGGSGCGGGGCGG